MEERLAREEEGRVGRVLMGWGRVVAGDRLGMEGVLRAGWEDGGDSLVYGLVRVGGRVGHRWLVGALLPTLGRAGAEEWVESRIEGGVFVVDWKPAGNGGYRASWVKVGGWVEGDGEARTMRWLGVRYGREVVGWEAELRRMRRGKVAKKPAGPRETGVDWDGRSLDWRRLDVAGGVE